MTRVSSEGPSFAKYRFSGIYHLKGGGDIHDWMKGVRLLTYMCDRVMEDIHYLFFIANMPSSRKVLLAMSEAIISRRGGSGGVDVSGVNASPANVLSPYRYVANNGVLVAGTMVNRGSLTRNINVGSSARFSSGYYTGGTIRAVEPTPTFKLVSKTFTSNTNWVVPNHNGYISVRIFGGGGGGGGGEQMRDGHNSGGGGGWMNNADLTIANGSSVSITIGKGGKHEQSGGTSSFGTWLSANGGTYGGFWAGNGGSGGGGAQGGAGGGGRGFQFGGGGEGGTFRGGGQGGAWGGNGGDAEQNGNNGTNTMGMSSVPTNDRGPAIGGRRGNNTYNAVEQWNFPGGGGGGGGYGANGGNGGNGVSYASSHFISGAGGGGGGWGKLGRGGDGTNMHGGGGGAYGPGGNGGGGNGSYGGGGGGGSIFGSYGGNGICIVQYYAQA